MPLKILTKTNIDQIIDAHYLSVIVFEAEWCMPCKSFAKVIAQMAEQYPDILFGIIDIEKEPLLATDFNVRSVPFVIILRKNIAVFAESGAMPATALTTLIEQAKQLDLSQIEQAIKTNQSSNSANES